MNTNLTPMDVYSSRMDIPFDEAAYCRGHKFSPEAVNLARAIRNAEAARLAVISAEQHLDHAEAAIKEALQNLRAKMNRDPV